jgi:hypothetical protein
MRWHSPLAIWGSTGKFDIESYVDNPVDRKNVHRVKKFGKIPNNKSHVSITLREFTESRFKKVIDEQRGP